MCRIDLSNFQQADGSTQCQYFGTEFNPEQRNKLIPQGIVFFRRLIQCLSYPIRRLHNNRNSLVQVH